ncbi:MAG: ParB N-terminal domain-containing protein, partial [Cetobacterium sp.]
MANNYDVSNSTNSRIIVEVKITDINSKDYNPRRSGLVMENVDKLIKAQEFPEIHLGKLDGELYVVDGYHRVAATNALEKDAIKAFITKFETEAELKKQAFIANVNHGVMLSELDIALNIYDFYVIEKELNPAANLSEIIATYSVPVRRGRQLFFWSVLNKEILETELSAVKDLSRAEEYSKFITNNKEKIGHISELLKEEVRRFYYKYNSLTIPELREAIDLQLIGKDYEEVQKERKIEEELKAEEERRELEASRENDIMQESFGDTDGDVSPEYFAEFKCDSDGVLHSTEENEVEVNSNVSYVGSETNRMIEEINNS